MKFLHRELHRFEDVQRNFEQIEGWSQFGFAAAVAPSAVANNSLFLDSSNSNHLTFKDGGGALHVIV